MMIGDVLENYTIIKYINSGSFGRVYEAVNNETNKHVAIKIPIKKNNGERWLEYEGNVYNGIHGTGIPTAVIIDSKKLKTKIMVMDLLGPSLESVLKTKKVLGLQFIIALMISMLEIVKNIHACGYVHRDLKPSNFVFSPDLTTLFCIDFGLARRYLGPNDTHVVKEEDLKFCGTSRFASISAHQGTTQSRKDDLEALVYIIVYLFRGKLPWQNVKRSTKDKKYDIIMQQKMDIAKNIKKFNRDLTREFIVYHKVVDTLDFYEKPPYNSLIGMFTKLYESKFQEKVGDFKKFIDP